LGPIFQSVVIDEAGQGTEPDCVIPLNRLTFDGRGILVGDPQQLRPHVLSKQAADAGLTTSLLERLMDRPGLYAQVLDTQYRMHPSLIVWPNDQFYNNQITNAPSTHTLQAPRGFPWTNQHRCIAFIHIPDHEQHAGRSFSNKKQVAMIAKLVTDFMDAGDIGRRDIGIITWYNGQNKLLQKEHCLRNIDIANVDGFQGEERDLMILSTVRSNARSRTGFTKDPNRLNVALTRCKTGLIVIGDATTLRDGDENGYWSNFLSLMPLFNEDL